MQARLGNATNDAQASLVMEQYNEFIRAAAMDVYTRCQWATAHHRTSVNVGIDQRFVDYPVGCSGSNIIQIGLWDAAASAMRPLRRARIPIQLNDDPLVAQGEPYSVPGRGMPTQYEPKERIEIYPRPDQPYALKLDYTANPDLALETDVCVVDAECIILLAMADAYDFQGDQALAQVQRAKAEKRIGQLRAWSSTMESFTRGRLNRLVANGARIGDGVVVYPGGDLPNSGVYPSTLPAGH